MVRRKLRVIVLSHGGVERLLKHLSDDENVEVAGIFVETQTAPRRSTREKIKRSLRYDGYVATAMKIASRFRLKETAPSDAFNDDLRERLALESLASDLGIPFYCVRNFHSDEAMALLKEMNADLGILYGTNIIRESVFKIPRLGSINLHQGLAPLYRGGPPVFWELFNGEKEVGLTIHHVAAAVDTGDIVLQKTVPLEYDFAKYGLKYESFIEDMRSSLAEPSARLMMDAVKLIATGSDSRIKQDTLMGRRYRLPTKKEKDKLLKTLRRRRKEFGTSARQSRAARDLS